MLLQKNGRLMMKCVCSECGITKTKFISQKTGQKGEGLIDFLKHFNPMETYDAVKKNKVPWIVDFKKGAELLKYAFKPVDMKQAKKNYKNIKEAYRAYKNNGGKLRLSYWALKYGYALKPTF